MSDHQLQTILERVAGGLDPDSLSHIGLAAMQQLHEAEENPRYIRDDRYADLLHTLGAHPELLEARPVVVDAEIGDVPCGNMRIRAALDLAGQSEEFRAWIDKRGFPIYVKKFTDAAERREWMMLDNQPFGEWIPDELAALVSLHHQEGGDVRALGFAEHDVSGLLALAAEPPAPQGSGDPDDAGGAPPDEPATKPGDLYRLGDHVLLCADAASPESYERLLEEVPGGWHAVWTDPPYGVAYNAEDRSSYFSPERLAKPFGEIKGDGRQEIEAYADWLAEVLACATGSMVEGGAVYLCHADKMVEAVSRAWRQAGLYFSSQLLWLKTVLVKGWADHHYQHEPLLYGWKPGEGAHRWFGDRSQTTVFEVASDHYGEDRERYVHPNQKPYELIRQHLENSTQPGEVVLDPFGGSGSTMITAHRLSRRCVTLELDPKYCDVIVARWERYSGEEAERVERAGAVPDDPVVADMAEEFAADFDRADTGLDA